MRTVESATKPWAILRRKPTCQESPLFCLIPYGGLSLYSISTIIIGGNADNKMKIVGLAYGIFVWLDTFQPSAVVTSRLLEVRLVGKVVRVKPLSKPFTSERECDRRIIIVRLYLFEISKSHMS